MSSPLEDSFYNIPRLLFGNDCIKEIIDSKCFIAGLGGLGAEIAKNLVLSGVGHLVIQDNKEASWKDLGSQFLLSPEDVERKKNRAEASCTKLAELNRHVHVSSISLRLDEHTDLQFLSEFQCVILTELPLQLQIKINDFCRLQDHSVKFISADVYGAFGWIFCDFGSLFTSVDPEGEEYKPAYITNITKGYPGIVTCVKDRKHDLQSDDIVLLTNIRGMNALNDKKIRIQKLDDYSFTICSTISSMFRPYAGGGIARKIPQPCEMTFLPLREELHHPHILNVNHQNKKDLRINHVGMLALHSFWEKKGRFPSLCDNDAEEFIKIAEEINLQSFNVPIDEIKKTLRKLALAIRGSLPPLLTFLGGIAAQEVLKALSAKYTPIQQWFYYDCQELVATEAENISDERSRYLDTEICLGKNLMTKLHNLNLFLVGFSATSSELLKMFALIGISTLNGKILIADDDIVKKNNLNNQFLFRPCHLESFKSLAATEAIKLKNNDMNIESIQQKVSPQSLDSFDSSFFKKQDMVLTSLDNVEGRRFVDSLCVKHSCPLIDSGTARTKGHVQVVIPFLTESFASQSDPLDEEYPYCTIKTFPSMIEHVVAWAKSKFENLFSVKPTAFNNFWAANPSTENLLQEMSNKNSIENISVVIKLLENRPTSWEDCIKLARLKFEKYFNHKAKQLLHIFPLDTKLCDGSSFWQAPKFPPSPLQFDEGNVTHAKFLVQMAMYIAQIYGIKSSSEEMELPYILDAIRPLSIPVYQPFYKEIITDEREERPNAEVSVDDPFKLATQIKSLNESGTKLPEDIRMFPIKFDKDDSSGHLEFIATLAILRAATYNIDVGDILRLKTIATHLIPALPTTTATVAGFMVIEMLRLLSNLSLEEHENCFFNLALPLVVMSAPLSAQKIEFGNDLSYTLWDRWYLSGKPELTLQEFITSLEERANSKWGQSQLTVSMILHNSTIIYSTIIPFHQTRKNKRMASLIKTNNYKENVDLTILYQPEGSDEIGGPPVTYNFGL